jgi:hypothetical protein
MLRGTFSTTSPEDGRRAISADTALRLARHLGTGARFWLNLQTRYDLAVTERDHGAASPPGSTAPRNFLTGVLKCLSGLTPEPRVK